MRHWPHADQVMVFLTRCLASSALCLLCLSPRLVATMRLDASALQHVRYRQTPARNQDRRPPATIVTATGPLLGLEAVAAARAASAGAQQVLRLAIYAGGGTGLSRRDLHMSVSAGLAARGILHSVALLTAEKVASISVARFDAVIFPGGRGSGQLASIGTEGAAAVRAFVAGGGAYIGVCGGAYLAIKGLDFFGPGVSWMQPWNRGSGNANIEFTTRGLKDLRLDPVSYGGNVTMFYENGPIIGVRSLPPEAQVLAHYRSEINAINAPRTRGQMDGSAAVVSINFGRGRVVAISAHPEGTMPPLPDVFYGAIAHSLALPAANDTSTTALAPQRQVMQSLTVEVPAFDWFPSRLEIGQAMRLPADADVWVRMMYGVRLHLQFPFGFVPNLAVAKAALAHALGSDATQITLGPKSALFTTRERPEAAAACAAKQSGALATRFRAAYNAAAAASTSAVAGEAAPPPAELSSFAVAGLHVAIDVMTVVFQEPGAPPLLPEVINARTALSQFPGRFVILTIAKGHAPQELLGKVVLPAAGKWSGPHRELRVKAASMLHPSGGRQDDLDVFSKARVKQLWKQASPEVKAQIELPGAKLRAIMGAGKLGLVSAKGKAQRRPKAKALINTKAAAKRKAKRKAKVKPKESVGAGELRNKTA